MNGEEILGTSTITYKYQITIPKRVRNTCKFEKGDLVVFVKDGDKLYLRTSADA